MILLEDTARHFTAERSLAITFSIIAGVGVGLMLWLNSRELKESKKPKRSKTPEEQRKSEKDMGHIVLTRNTRWALIWMVELALVLTALSFWGAFKMEDGFPTSHIDIIIAITLVIGIIGALWALFARVDAEKAFLKARDTLDALGNSFSFNEIFDDKRIPSVLNAIGEENKSVFLFLGFPCIACFYQKRGSIPGQEKRILKMFNLFVEKLKDITVDMQNDVEPYQVNIAMFSIEEMDRIISEKITSGTADAKEKEFYRLKWGSTLLIDQYKRILKDIIDEKKNREGWRTKIKLHVIDKQKEKFRFAILRDGNDSSQNLAIIWVVPDFPTDKAGFESACFQTKDGNLINMLENVFDNCSDDSQQIGKEIEAWENKMKHAHI